MLVNCWYIAALSSEVSTKKPLSKTVADQPLVLFRNTEGEASALFDRCPHRNVQLSRGKIKKGCIQCPYHGWEFNTEGQCTHIPSLTPDENIPKQAQARKIPIKEQQGYIWVWVGKDKPVSEPFILPHDQESGWGQGRLGCVIPNTIENVIENFIDCPHTGYIHGGLFRSPASHLAETEVQSLDDGVKIEINEETKTGGVLGKILVKDEDVTHQDRFIYPSIVQVAYGFGRSKDIIGYQICTPISEFETQVYVYVIWHMKWLNPLVKLFFPWVGRMILKQDFWILENQGKMIQTHGENFVSVQSDTANLWIRASRQRIQRGEEPSAHTKKVRYRL